MSVRHAKANQRDPFVFTRIHLPRPTEPESILQLLSRLMSSDIPRPLAFESQAGDGEVAHILGCSPRAVQRLKRLIRGVIPGTQFEAAKRANVANVSRITSTAPGFTLGNTDSAEPVVAALFSAFASRRETEVVALQLVLGRASRARQLPKEIPDPTQSLASRLLTGTRAATGDLQRQLRAAHASPRLEATVRIGVGAGDVKRQHALTFEAFGALQLLEAAGAHLTLVRDSVERWNRCTLGRSSFRLSAEQILPLLAWPLGRNDYPGVVPVHPRRLPASEILSRSESIFAVGTAPGPERLIGLDTESRLKHVLVTGPTGAGKSTLLEHLALSDNKAARACVVIEPKKQLVEGILSRLPPEAAGQVVVLDAADEESVVGFNPLDLGDRDPYVVVDGILAALAAVFSDGWGPRTEYIIQGALLSLALAGKKRGQPYTLLDLPRLLTDAPFRREVTSAAQDDPIVTEVWAEFEQMRPGQRASVVAAPLNKLRKIVMRKHLAAVLGQSQPRFRLRDVFRENKTVLVPLNESLLGTGAARLLGNLFTAEIFMAAQERASEKDPEKRPGMVIIDEVQNYLHLPTPLDVALGVFRSYGVGLHAAHQHRGQLTTAMRTALDTNARNKICFSLEADDARDMARMAPQLTADDFLALPIREIYARLLGKGVPTAWCSARTLPPAKKRNAHELIRQASRDAFGALPEQLKPVGAPAGADTPDPNSTAAKDEGISGPQSHQRRRRS